MFQQKMAANCLFVHQRTGENNLPVSDWLKNKYFLSRRKDGLAELPKQKYAGRT
jgi:hypothetical protein